MGTPKRSLYLFLSFLLVVLLVLAACGGEPRTATEPRDEPGSSAPAESPSAPEQPAEPKKPIVLVDAQWQTLWINNEIAKFIIEEGYGYPVEIKTITTPVFQQAMEKGEVDVHMELWRTNIIDWYNKVTGDGTMLDLGPTYERSTQGWYVPRYVIEGDSGRGLEPLAPDLKSVFDLPRYKQVFADPENPQKGLLVNGITGWNVTEVNKVKLQAYGLTDDYNTLEPGSAAALDAAVAGAVKKGKPILFYYWEPTWLMGMYDFVKLEEPEFNEDCWSEIQSIVAGEKPIEEASANAGCAFETLAIHKGVHKSLKERAPEVVEMLKKLNVGTDPLNKTSAFMESEDASAKEAAMYYFENYPDRWREWLPDDVEQKVEAALAEAGVQVN